MAKIFTGMLVVSIIAAVLLWREKVNWAKYTAEQFHKIKSSLLPAGGSVNLKELAGLPEPVRRYFKLVLKDSAPIIKSTFISQIGGFRAKPKMKGWSEMRAEQLFTSHPRAFVWHSAISVLPGLTIKVCDSYIEGKGGMKGKIFSLLTLIDSKNQRELDEGALQRYLAEAVWFPTALLPSQGVVWTALDSHHAKAAITDSGLTVSLEFEFNDKGEVVSIYTPSRYREVSGTYEPTPWKGSFSNYIHVDGYLIPEKGAVEWHLKDQVYPYWKAKLQDIRYEF